MTLLRLLQWLVFGGGVMAALYTGLSLLWLALAVTASSSQNWVVLVPGILIACAGIASLVVIPFAYRLLRRGRWLSMGLVLAAVAAVLPVLIVSAQLFIGPIYDERGRPIQPEAAREAKR